MQHRNDSLKKAFAAALIKARGNRSQAEFARLLEIPNQQTYQRYEKGLVPSGIILHQIATRLGVTVDQLLTGGKQPSEAAKLAGEDVLPWGFELEESTQFTVALHLLSREMTARQLLTAANAILDNRALKEGSKLFWMKLLGEAAIVKSEQEEKLKTGEPKKPGQ